MHDNYREAYSISSSRINYAATALYPPPQLDYYATVLLQLLIDRRLYPPRLPHSYFYLFTHLIRETIQHNIETKLSIFDTCIRKVLYKFTAIKFILVRSIFGTPLRKKGRWKIESSSYGSFDELPRRQDIENRWREWPLFYTTNAIVTILMLYSVHQKCDDNWPTS